MLNFPMMAMWLVGFHMSNDLRSGTIAPVTKQNNDTMWLCFEKKLTKKMVLEFI